METTLLCLESSCYTYLCVLTVNARGNDRKIPLVAGEHFHVFSRTKIKNPVSEGEWRCLSNISIKHACRWKCVMRTAKVRKDRRFNLHEGCKCTLEISNDIIIIIIIITTIIIALHSRGPRPLTFSGWSIFWYWKPVPPLTPSAPPLLEMWPCSLSQTAGSSNTILLSSLS